MEEMSGFSEIIKKMEENLEEIRRFGVKRIGVFGSYGGVNRGRRVI